MSDYDAFGSKSNWSQLKRGGNKAEIDEAVRNVVADRRAIEAEIAKLHIRIEREWQKDTATSRRKVWALKDVLEAHENKLKSLKKAWGDLLQEVEGR